MSLVRRKADRKVFNGLRCGRHKLPSHHSCCGTIGENGISTDHVDMRHFAIGGYRSPQADESSNLSMTQHIGIFGFDRYYDFAIKLRRFLGERTRYESDNPAKKQRESRYCGCSLDAYVNFSSWIMVGQINPRRPLPSIEPQDLKTVSHSRLANKITEVLCRFRKRHGNNTSGIDSIRQSIESTR
jgi:hypothetical protein